MELLVNINQKKEKEKRSGPLFEAVLNFRYPEAT